MAMRVGALDAPLLQLSSAGDRWTLRDANTHLLALGTTGSGKSSSTLRYCIISYLKQLVSGGLFCVAKPEDAEAIIAYCRDTGRSGSLINWTGSNGGYNFLAHELARTGNINAVIDVLLAVLDIVRTSSPSHGKASEQFWIDSVTQMLRATVPVVFAATGTVRIEDILTFVRQAPSSREEMQDPQWQQGSAFFRMFHAAVQRLQSGPVPGFDNEAGRRAMAYWSDDYCRLDARTAGNIRISLTTALSRFEQGLLKDAFCGDTTICPELMMSGAALILMNFPVQTHGEDAAIGQKIFKYMAQRILLARNGMAAHLRTVPVMIVADEADQFLYDDASFLARCRSALVSVLFATQSLPTLYAKIGGDHPHDRTHHLISNFNTIALHSSACPETNEWFARKLGKTVHQRASFNESHGTNSNYGANMGYGSHDGTNASWGTSSSYSTGPNGGSYSSGSNSGSGRSSGTSDNFGRNRGHGSNHGTSHGWSEQVDWVLEPGFFARALKTGGPANGNRVSAVWYQAGRCFAASGGNSILVEMAQ